MNFRPLLGAAQIAIGRGEGITKFAATPAAFLASLAPLIAFPLVGAVMLLMKGKLLGALVVLLFTMVAQLAPAVVSHALAVRWGREEQWLRYATAFNWCQLAIPLAAFVLLILLQVGTGMGLSDEAGAELLILVLGLYGLWLHWMLARYGLLLSRWRAVLLVALVNVATVALVLGPRLVQMALT